MKFMLFIVIMTSVTTTALRLPGVWISPNSLAEKELEWGVKFPIMTLYRPIRDVGYKFINTSGKKLQLVTEFFDCGNITEIANGSCDASVRSLAKDIAKIGTPIYIRMFHEFNWLNYPWSFYPFTSEKVADFKKAWRRIVNIYRSEKAPVEFQWCLMASNQNMDSTPYNKFYPGDDFVDMVGIDIYINKNAKYLSLKERLDKNIYAQLVKFNKDIFIGEVGCTESNPAKAQWLEDSWRDIADHFPRIKIVNYFLENKAGGRDWGLHTPEQTKAFVRGLKYFINHVTQTV